jgi:hypothetical protein
MKLDEKRNEGSGGCDDCDGYGRRLDTTLEIGAAVVDVVYDPFEDSARGSLIGIEDAVQ